MSYKNPPFGFKKKKKKQQITLEAVKAIGIVSSMLMAINSFIKEKLSQQQYSFYKPKKKDNTNTLSILAGLVGGLLAGTLVALLFAPEPGDKLRERISQLFDEEDARTLDNTFADARQNAIKNLNLN